MTQEKWRLDDLPAPGALPWLGNLHQLDSKRMHAQLEAWGRRFGKTYTFKLGPKRILVTSDVEIAHAALKNRPHAPGGAPAVPGSQRRHRTG
jgi:hypothetical protein